MSKIEIIEVESFGVVTKHAIIEHADGSFTSMLKSTYDEQLAAQEAQAQPLA